MEGDLASLGIFNWRKAKERDGGFSIIDSNRISGANPNKEEVDLRSLAKLHSNSILVNNFYFSLQGSYQITSCMYEYEDKFLHLISEILFIF